MKKKNSVCVYTHTHFHTYPHISTARTLKKQSQQQQQQKRQKRFLIKCERIVSTEVVKIVNEDELSLCLRLLIAMY